MSAISAPQPAAGGATSGLARRERQRWIVALVIALLLGLLLGWSPLHKSTPSCRTSLPADGPPQKMTGSTGTRAAPNKGSGAKLGAPGEDDASRRRGSGSTTSDAGGGGGGKGRPGDGDLGHGTPWKASGEDYTASSGNSRAEPDQEGGPEGSRDMKGGGGGDARILSPQELHGQLPQQGAGKPPPAPGGDLSESEAPPARETPVSPGTAAPDALVARDLRYDKSELPRYPNAVTQSASDTAAPSASRPSDPNVSVSAIVTKDDLPTVAAWYHDHLSGWTEQNLGQMAMFWPPDRKADPRTVWVLVDPKTGQTEALLWKPARKEP